MATLKTLTPAAFTHEVPATAYNPNLWSKFMQFADGQKDNRTLWFFIVLMVHGVFILPMPVVLAYYFNAPFITLVVTMVAFFANIIANMAGGSIRLTLTLFAASVLVHLAMALIIIL